MYSLLFLFIHENVACVAEKRNSPVDGQNPGFAIA